MQSIPVHGSSVFLEALRHPYYIVAPRYIRTSAGVKVLHLLCHALNRMGERAYLIVEPYYHPYFAINPDLITPVLTQRHIERHFEQGLTPITIYPETVAGNPYSAPFSVRYVLNYAGLLGGETTFTKIEYCISYSKAIADSLPDSHHTIFIPASDPNFFSPGTAQREGACFYAGKFKYFHKGRTLAITDGATEITRDRPDSQTPEQIRDLFRRSELFYCYENSALAIEAILCGCPVVFLPNEHFTELIGKEELGGLGYAWGTDPIDITRAKATVAQGHQRFLTLYAEAENAIREFVAETQTAASKIPYQHMIQVPQLSHPSLLVEFGGLIKTGWFVIRQKGLIYLLTIIFKRLAAGRVRIREK